MLPSRLDALARASPGWTSVPAAVIADVLSEGVCIPQERIDRIALADTSWWQSSTIPAIPEPQLASTSSTAPEVEDDRSRALPDPEAGHPEPGPIRVIIGMRQVDGLDRGPVRGPEGGHLGFRR
jgi:hypothetical protein